MSHYLGIEIGGTKLQLVSGDADAKIVGRRRFGVERSKGAAGIQEQIEQGLRDLFSKGRPQAIGAGFGGPLDWRTGKIYRSHHIEGWSEFELGNWLQKQSGAPAFIDNDGNVAALAEATHGVAKGFNPVFYVTLGSGVGGGLVVDGKIYHGATPGEAEIGHVRLDRSGTTVESRCSGWAVDARIRSVKTAKPGSILAGLLGESVGGEAKYLATACEQGDVSAKKILNEIGDDLGFGLSHVVHLFHPQIIVLGGGLSAVGEPLKVAVQEVLERFVMEAFKPAPLVMFAQLGEDVVPVGALELARREKGN